MGRRKGRPSKGIQQTQHSTRYQYLPSPRRDSGQPTQQTEDQQFPHSPWTIPFTQPSISLDFSPPSLPKIHSKKRIQTTKETNNENREGNSTKTTTDKTDPQTTHNTIPQPRILNRNPRKPTTGERGDTYHPSSLSLPRTSQPGFGYSYHGHRPPTTTANQRPTYTYIIRSPGSRPLPHQYQAIRPTLRVNVDSI